MKKKAKSILEMVRALPLSDEERRERECDHTVRAMVSDVLKRYGNAMRLIAKELRPGQGKSFTAHHE